MHSGKEISWVVFGQSVALLGGFITIKCLTRVLGPEGYGHLALGLSISGFINLFLYGPIGQSVLRYFSFSRENQNLPGYFQSLKKIHVSAFLIIFSLAVMVIVPVFYFVGLEWALLIGASAIYAVIAGINLSFQSLQNAARQRKIAALHQGVDVWLRLIFAIFLICLFENKGYFSLFGFAIGTMFTTLSQVYFLTKNKLIGTIWNKKALRKNKNQEIHKKMVFYILSFTYWAGFGVINNFGDRWILQFLYGPKEVGIYSGISQIANAPILFFIGIISQFITPIIFETAGTMTKAAQAKSSNRLLQQTIVISTIVLFGFTLIAYFAGKIIVQLLTTSIFSQYSAILWVIVLGLSIFNIAQLLTMKGLNSHRPEIYILPKGVQAFSFLILAYFLARRFSLMGVATASAISYLIYLAMVIRANKRLNEIP